MLKLIHRGPYGDTVASYAPQLDALKQCVYLRSMGDSYQIKTNPDGSYTVLTDGDATTFARPTALRAQRPTPNGA